MKKLKKRLIITGITLGALSKFLTNPKLEGRLDKNKWYKVSPDGGVNADGSKWHGLIKVQDTSKVLIYFYGGGLSIDSFTASHDIDYLQVGFYYAKRPLDGLEHFGITSSNHDNSFKDYTDKAYTEYANKYREYKSKDIICYEWFDGKREVGSDFDIKDYNNKKSILTQTYRNPYKELCDAYGIRE